MPLHKDYGFSKLTLIFLLLSCISLASSPLDETTDARTANQILHSQEELIASNNLHLQTCAKFHREASQFNYNFRLNILHFTEPVTELLEKIESEANQMKKHLEEQITQIQCSTEEQNLMRRRIEEIDHEKTYHTTRIKENCYQIKEVQDAINEGLLNSLDAAAMVTMSSDIFRRCLGNGAALAKLVKDMK